MTDQYPQPRLDKLIERLSVLIGVSTEKLQDDPDRVDDWYDEISRQLRRYHLAAYMAGDSRPSALDNPKAERLMVEDLQTQFKFLRQFKAEIQDAAEWQAGWNARAEMYAKSIQVPYWRGKTRLLPLPAMPGDGSTQCLTNCKCAWNIVTVDEAQDDYDCYWIYGATERHCQSCRERQSQWAPLQIRGGVLL